MEKWEDNKKHHEGYWGKLYTYLIKNKLNHKEVSEEWKSLFKYELGNKNLFSYIVDSKVVTNDFSKYTSDKNLYLKKRLDKHITKDTDAVIDLGSGWGRHSIHIASSKPSYKIISGELSDSGRRVTEYFTNKYGLDIETFQFNWRDNKSFIELLSTKRYKEIVIFTSNTIEQIDYIDVEFFQDLLDLPIEKIKVIHIEPVKFQYDGLPFPLNNHYNRNLKAVLDTLVSMGRIKIGDIIPQYWGHNNSLTSKNNILIEWEKL